MAKIIHIDGTNLIVGRLASHVAKQALLGAQVHIVNCEKVIVTGAPSAVKYHYYLRKRDLGTPQKGPHYSKLPDRFVRRIIRGMLPHRQYRGKEAYHSIMCYIGIPANLATQKFQSLPWASTARLTTTKFQTIGDLCFSLGWMK